METNAAFTDTATEELVTESTVTETPVAEPATEPTIEPSTEKLESGPVVDLARGLEAIFMVADEPQSLVSLATALNAPVAEIRKTITLLRADFDGEGDGPRRGFELREVGGGWRIYVRSDYDAAVRDFVFTQNPSRLSQAALETLAVIAYKQPISRGAVAAVRAVNVDSVVRTLLGRGLITEAFTDNETGAIHYETTELMLVQLGINSIAELPPISPLLSDGSDGFDEQR
ncbi:hypothetical protein A20C1_01656 [marine actinobacterium PHSC20C1]|nr:hypothetical protein A20C1_01656 [marine actinobacterium PHSC20C1]